MTDDNTLDTTVDEWQAEIEKMESEGDPGLSVEELAEQLMCSATTARRRANALVEKGACVLGIGVRRAKDGRIKRLPVYQLKKGKK